MQSFPTSSFPFLCLLLPTLRPPGDSPKENSKADKRTQNPGSNEKGERSGLFIVAKKLRNEGARAEHDSNSQISISLQ